MRLLRCPRHSGNFGRKLTMFDYHMHTIVSFDGRERGWQMARAAKEKGLKEICFTDHLDYDPLGKWEFWPLIRMYTMLNMTIWKFRV